MNTSSQFTDHTETKVIITKEYFRYLEKRDFELDCLEAGGVDNWHNYHDSLEDGGYFNYKND